jgi:hypothetical protein
VRRRNPCRPAGEEMEERHGRDSLAHRRLSSGVSGLSAVKQGGIACSRS